MQRAKKNVLQPSGQHQLAQGVSSRNNSEYESVNSSMLPSVNLLVPVMIRSTNGQ